MKFKYIESSFLYDGSQLRSLFAYLNFELEGDSIIAWQGPCNIPFDKMIDGEDLLARSAICVENMLHFIVELFGTTLAQAVAMQRLLASLASDTLQELNATLRISHGMGGLRRDGDDLFIDDRKLSISIATISPVSTLIHFAVNCDNRGTPVPTVSLADLNVAPAVFAKRLSEKFAAEAESIARATRKVRPTTSF